ncbi:DMT family transporter [Actinobacillus porcinus]|uniref:DMT family transporter n=1 Tax=Actinobacillus porcinus TaxID=51048 RepID=UPI0023530147|nr:DMT family transporter [Actinobacillus porcinus]
MRQKYPGEWILFLVSMIAASGWFFSKFAMEEFPPIGFMGARFTLGFCLFLPFAYSQLKQLSRSQIIQACLVGICYTVNISLWTLGLIYSQHLGEGAFLFSLSMLIAPLVSWLFFKDKPQKIFWVSLPIAILGLTLLAFGRGQLYFSLGSLIFLVSSIAAAIYFVLNNHFAQNIPVLSLTTLQVGVVGICCSLYSYFFENYPPTFSPSIWGWFLASLLLATNGRILLQTLGQKHCQVSTAALIMVLEPVWTCILSMLIFNEIMTWVKGMGCFCILLALLIYRLPRLRSSK